MSEYWISQGRRMCTYCKCWTADNRASINFHEQGKNHKENVVRKLDELRKKGLEDARKRETESSDLAKIERAALESFKKDMLDNKGMSGAYGQVGLSISSAQKAPPISSALTDNNTKISASDVTSEADQTTLSSTATSDGWTTAYSDEGHLYYWNHITNETSWYSPDGNNSTVANEAEPAVINEADPGVANGAEPGVADDAEPGVANDTEPAVADNVETVGAKGAESPVAKDAESSSSTPTSDGLGQGKKQNISKPIKRSSHTGYGQWETVAVEDTVPIADYDLPTDSKNITMAPEDIPLPPTSTPVEASDSKARSEPQGKFKMKRVSLGVSSGDGGPVAFKKPKVIKKRQARGALDE